MKSASNDKYMNNIEYEQYRIIYFFLIFNLKGSLSNKKCIAKVDRIKIEL